MYEIVSDLDVARHAHAAGAALARLNVERARLEGQERGFLAGLPLRQCAVYDRAKWEALNAARISSMTPEAVEEAYGLDRYAARLMRRAAQAMTMSPGSCWDYLQLDPMSRFQAGLPPRDEFERACYEEWRKPDAKDMEEA